MRVYSMGQREGWAAKNKLVEWFNKVFKAKFGFESHFYYTPGLSHLPNPYYSFYRVNFYINNSDNVPLNFHIRGLNAAFIFLWGIK